MSHASPPPTALRPGDSVRFVDGDTTHTGLVRTVSWEPRFGVPKFVLRVDVDGETRRIDDGDLI